MSKFIVILYFLKNFFKNVSYDLNHIYMEYFFIMFVLNKHIESKVFEDTIFDINLHELKTKFLEGNVLTTIYFPSQVSIDGCFKKLLKNYKKRIKTKDSYVLSITEKKYNKLYENSSLSLKTLEEFVKARDSKKILIISRKEKHFFKAVDFSRKLKLETSILSNVLIVNFSGMKNKI